MMLTFNDSGIIEAFRTGGEARDKAWEYLYKEHRDKITRMIIAKGGRRDEALDAFQDVLFDFEKAITVPGFVLRYTLYTYLFRCVYNRWLRIKGRQWKIEEIKDKHMAGFVQSVEQDKLNQEQLQILEESLSSIGERCKTILKLFYTFGYNMVEISGIMGFKGGAQVAKNEKKKCMDAYLKYLREHPRIKELLKT